MFLLAEAQFNSTTMSLDGVHEKLRANGCHSPTRESLYRVFKAIKSSAMLARLTLEPGKTLEVRLLDVLKILNGPDARLDITGARGCEFSGWYTEFLTLKLGGLIDMNPHGIVIPHLFLTKFCGGDITEDQLKESLWDWLAKHSVLDRVRYDILERVRKYDLTHLLLAGTYTNRSL